MSIHVFRNTAGFCRRNQELRTTPIGCVRDFSPLITLEEDTGIMNLSVGLPADLEMYVWRDISLFAALVRQTVVEMARVALALEFAPDQRRSFLVPSRVSTIVLSISVLRRPYPATCVCDDSDDAEHGFQNTSARSLLLSPSSPVPTLANQPTSIAPIPCVDDVVIRIVDCWQVTSGLFFLSRSRSARQLSRSRSVTRAQQRENYKHTVWSEV